MITAIEIENFKGIGKRVRVELKPLTLLFGPNSAGKSTIAQAMQYAYEVLHRHNLDADRTTMGGDRVDLGGFANFVHDRDLSREVRLRFDLDLGHADLRRRFLISHYTFSLRKFSIREPLALGGIGSKVQSGWVEFAVAWDASKQAPYVQAYEVGLDGQRLGTMTRGHGRALEEGNYIFCNLDMDHPLLRWPAELARMQEYAYCIAHYMDHSMGGWCHLDDYAWGWHKIIGLYYGFGDAISLDRIEDLIYGAEPDHVHELTPLSELDPQTLRRVRCNKTEACDEFYLLLGLRRDDRTLCIQSFRFPSRFWPDKDKTAAFVNAVSATMASRSQYVTFWNNLKDALPNWHETLSYAIESEMEDETGRDAKLRTRFLSEALTRLLVGPGQILREELQQLRYVGPLRDTPPRQYQAPRRNEAAQWFNGLAAWDALQECDNEVFSLVNECLAAPYRLDTGYSLERHRFRQLDENGLLMQQLREGLIQSTEDLEQGIRDLPVRTEVNLIQGETTRLSLHDVGEGIRQALPVVVAVLDPTRGRQSGVQGLVTVEQPELHLHPRQQAALGDVLLSGALGKAGNWIVVETHSEHLILRLLRRIRETASGRLPADAIGLTPDQLAVAYVQKTDEGVQLVPLRVDETGEFLDPWPNGFFEERGEELFA